LCNFKYTAASSEAANDESVCFALTNEMAQEIPTGCGLIVFAVYAQQCKRVVANGF
jgi:hypothetical protein